MSRPWLIAAAALLAIVQSGCANSPSHSRVLPLPLLRPADLQLQLSLQQRLSIAPLAGSPVQTIDVLLEIDATELRLAAVAMGRRLLSVRWDGAQLKQQRATKLPDTVRAETIVRDVLLVLAPTEALRAGLPAGWRLHQSEQRRELWHRGELVVEIRYGQPRRWAGQVELQQYREGYRLRIQTAADR